MNITDQDRHRLRIKILDVLIAAGWGDIPFTKIPANWRKRKPPSLVGRPRGKKRATVRQSPEVRREKARLYVKRFRDRSRVRQARADFYGAWMEAAAVALAAKRHEHEN